MKKLILGLLLICSINVLVASSHPNPQITRMVIGDEPADFTFVRNGKNRSPDVPILLIEEELTNSYFSNDGHRSCVFVFAANQKDLKKYRETIEKERQDERNDPRFLPKANFIIATHLLKGSATFDHGCAMVNLRIEDRKGCIRAQKKISVSGRKWEVIYKLIREAARSLGYQICNSKSNEQTCSKSHYTDELFCPYTIELTRVKDIIKNGINRGLKATSPEITSLKETSKRVIFINPTKGEIKNIPLNSGNYSVRTGYKQAYDYKNCKVYLEALDKKEDKDLNRAVVRVTSSTPNKKFNSNTRLIFEIMDVEPLIDISWYDLSHAYPTFSKKGTYVKTDIASKTIYGDQEKYATMQMVVKRAGEAHIDNKCDIDDAKEFARGYWFDIPGYKLSYEYDMHIRPATKSEIRQARGFLKNMKNSFKDRQLYKTLNNGKIINKWKNRPENQEKLKKEMDDKMKLRTD